jgi:iron complex outermembrane receptor protein
MNTRYDEELIEHRIRNHATPSTVNMQYIDRDSEATVQNASGYMVGNIETGEFAHRIVVGLDYMYKDLLQKDISARDIGVFDLLNPIYATPDIASYGATEASWSPWGTTLKTTGFYLQDQIQFEQWEILAGLRYDSFKTTGFEVDSVSPEQSDNQLSPKLGVVYKLNEQQSIYATWMTGFLPPEGWLNMEMYGGPFKPSTSELFEIGHKQMFFDERLLFTTAVYQLSNNNVVVYANDEANPDLYVQRGQEQSKGIEFELNGKATDNLQLAANYAYNKAEITKDTDPANIGKPKENAPEHTANLWSKYNFIGNWNISGGVTYVDRRHTFVESLQLPSYTIYNTGLHYTHKDFDLNLLVKNLTDEVHWTGGYNYGRVFPGMPRDISLSMRYRF